MCNEASGSVPWWTSLKKPKKFLQKYRTCLINVLTSYQPKGEVLFKFLREYGGKLKPRAPEACFKFRGLQYFFLQSLGRHYLQNAGIIDGHKKNDCFADSGKLERSQVTFWAPGSFRRWILWIGSQGTSLFFCRSNKFQAFPLLLPFCFIVFFLFHPFFFCFGFPEALNSETNETVAIKIIEAQTDAVTLKKEIEILKDCESDYVVGYRGTYRTATEIWVLF